ETGWAAGYRKVDADTIVLWFREIRSSGETDGYVQADELPLTVGQWHHFYLYRAGATIGVYVDGDFVTPVISDFLDFTNPSTGVSLGEGFMNLGTNGECETRLDEVRIESGPT